jgi:chitinase
MRLFAIGAVLGLLICLFSLQLHPGTGSRVAGAPSASASASAAATQLGQALRSPAPGKAGTTPTPRAPAGTATPTATPIATARPTPPPTPTPTPATTAAPTPTPAPAPAGFLGWSSGYYVGWQQAAYPPQTIPWKGITHLLHFSIMTSAARDGSINVGGHQLTPAFMQAAVATAHQQHRKILISIGGADDNNFDAACNATNRSRFIANLVGVMQTYGYDGIDLDIEQDFGFPAHVDYIACVAGVRAALDRITPRPALTMAADPDWQSYMASQVQQYVDQINLMTYWSGVTVVADRLGRYTSLGIPKSKLGVGLGLGGDGGIDTTAAACAAKTAFVLSNGYGGVMEWRITDDQQLHAGLTPCVDAIAVNVRVL